MPQTEEARSKPLVGNARVFDLGLFGVQRNPRAGASGWSKAGCAACSAQSWNPRAGASGWKGEEIKHPNCACLSRLAPLTTPAHIFLKRGLLR